MHSLATMQYGRLKTLHYMSRNAIGHRDNGNWQGPQRDSVVVPEESPRRRGPTRKCPSSYLSPWNFRDSAFWRHSIWYLRLRCAWIAMKKTRSFGYDSEGICWFARTFWENLLYSSYLSTISGTLFSKSGLSVQPHSARVGNKLLSEHQSNIKPELVLLQTHVSLTVTTVTVDDVVLVARLRTINVWWKLISCFYISSRQKSLKFESWFFVHEEPVLHW